MRICMVGVGLMGHGIAKNILKTGQHRLSFLHHEGNQPVEDLLEAGAAPAQNLADIVPDADIILLCVTGAPEVEAVLFDTGGIYEHARAGQIIVDCSTSLPERSRAFASQLADRQVAYVDAAMTRTPKEAEMGRLNLILGGDQADIDRVMPVLRCFADTITTAGPVGAGHGLKLIHNYVSLGYAAILAEAAAAARMDGIDTDRFIHVLEAGGGRSVVLDRFRPYLTENDISGLRFSMANAAKDIDYFTTANQTSDVARAIQKLFAESAAEMGADESVLKLVDTLSARPAQADKE